MDSDGDGGTISSAARWIPPFSMVLSGMAYGLGMGPMCFILLVELFPVRARTVCSAILLSK